MLKLEDIIDAKEGREIKRALAAKMVLEGFETHIICKLLEVSASFVSKWKNVYEAEGAEGLLLNHKGSQSFLTSVQKNEVIVYLKNLNHFSVAELRDHIESSYGVVYKSKQSYYDLFDEAGISWHKSQKINPKRDEKKILAKREDIKKTQRHESEIKSGDLCVFIEDECHVLWGDTLGYVWGKKNERIELPITNERTRQTYYGAIDVYTREFVLSAFDKANGEHTVAFVKQLQALREGKKLLLIWDRRVITVIHR